MSAFERAALQAKEDIDDALGIARPSTYQMPAGAPNPGERFGAPPLGAPSQQPMATRFAGMQPGLGMQMGPGRMQANASLSPSGGMQGANVGYSMPMAGGQAGLSAGFDPRLRLAQLQAQYQRGPFSANVGYQPNGGVNVGAQYRQAFQEGGLATSVHNPQDYHERDIDFINTRNQHMREMVGKMAYALGGLAVKG